MDNKKLVSIIIPCFNEERNISTNARSILDYFKNNCPDYQLELLLINDGSNDLTGKEIDALAKELNNIRTFHFKRNQGRGAAIKEGIKRSSGDILIVMDADLSYDVQHIGDILDQFKNDPKTDVVVVSPYMKGGLVRGVPFQRLILSKMANWILAGFFENNLSTVTCVVRGYRGNLIRNLPLFENGKELHLEILRKLALKGASIIEIPGRLVWKETKERKKRKAGGLKIARAATNHIWLGLLIKPTRLIKYTAFLLLFISLWETSNLFRNLYSIFQLYPQGWNYSIWKALSMTFTHSPHTVVIAVVTLILSFQMFFFLYLFQFLKLQQEETLKHLIEILSESKSNSKG